MHRAPTSVKILSILGMVFFAWGLFGLIGVGAMLFGVRFLPPDPSLRIYNDPGYLLGTGILLAVGLPIMILLLVSSIGSLSLKPWARIGMLIYAVTTILNGVAGMAFNFFYVIPLMLSWLAPNDPTRAGTIGGAVGGGVCGGVIGMIYPVFVLYFFTRPQVIDAFHGIFPPSRDPEEDDYEEDRRYRDDEDRRRRRYPEGNSDQFTNRPGE